MKKHFHDRKRITDFMRHFGSEQANRGELFALAQLFLDIDDALVKTCLFQGDSREISKGGKYAHLFVRKAMRFARIDVQRADYLPIENQWHAQERNESFPSGNFDVLITR